MVVTSTSGAFKFASNVEHGITILLFLTNGEEEEDGETMLNDGGKHKCTRCGRDNHTVDRCVARCSVDGTVLHMMGNIEEVDYEVGVQPDNPNSHCGKN